MHGNLIRICMPSLCFGRDAELRAAYTRLVKAGDKHLHYVSVRRPCASRRWMRADRVAPSTVSSPGRVRGALRLIAAKTSKRGALPLIAVKTAVRGAFLPIVAKGCRKGRRPAILESLPASIGHTVAFLGHLPGMPPLIAAWRNARSGQTFEAKQ